MDMVALLVNPVYLQYPYLHKFLQPRAGGGKGSLKYNWATHPH